MSTKLTRITEIAKSKPKERFTSLAHLINENMLKECHRKLDGKKATGLDKVTKEMYEENLEENIGNLYNRLKKGKYKPIPVRRAYINKPGTNKLRPLGIPEVLIIGKILSKKKL